VFVFRSAMRRLFQTLAGVLGVAGCSVDSLAEAPQLSAAQLERSCPEDFSPWLPQPQDDGRHARQSVEAWYFQARLTDDKGARYDVALNVIASADTLLGAAPALTTLAVTDYSEQQPVFTRESFVGSGVYSTDSTTANVAVRAHGRENSAKIQQERTQIAASAQRYALQLKLEAQKPPALHGENGWVRFPLGYDAYYSRMLLRATGTLDVGDKVLEVTGSAWSEHQYGVAPTVNWTWFALQLTDGRELMVYDRQASGGFPAVLDATVVSEDCVAKTYKNSAVRVSTGASNAWTSAETGYQYSSSWQLEIPKENLSLTVEVSAAGSEIVPPPGFGVPFQYAACEVTGADAQPLSKLCFVEQAVSN
jgi:predicted secreted hydrolase